MTTNSTPTTTSSSARREARRRAWEMADKISHARRRGYARILRREVEALRAMKRGALQDLKASQYGTSAWDGHLSVYMNIYRQLVKLHYEIAFWEGRKAAQKAILQQNPWL